MKNNLAELLAIDYHISNIEHLLRQREGIDQEIRKSLRMLKEEIIELTENKNDEQVKLEQKG